MTSIDIVPRCRVGEGYLARRKADRRAVLLMYSINFEIQVSNSLVVRIWQAGSPP